MANPMNGGWVGIGPVRLQWYGASPGRLPLSYWNTERKDGRAPSSVVPARCAALIESTSAGNSPNTGLSTESYASCGSTLLVPPFIQYLIPPSVNAAISEHSRSTLFAPVLREWPPRVVAGPCWPSLCPLHQKQGLLVAQAGEFMPNYHSLASVVVKVFAPVQSSYMGYAATVRAALHANSSVRQLQHLTLGVACW